MVLRGERIIDPGERVTVVGQLRVIDHPARIVNGVPVAGWVEVRVEEGALTVPPQCRSPVRNRRTLGRGRESCRLSRTVLACGKPLANTGSLRGRFWRIGW
ncbi:MAG TPA: hypothetical protein VKE74_11585, partial [Gemmataceae bacterium]|nr:hypothetical protein [Gemmataceae bacterium]